MASTNRNGGPGLGAGAGIGVLMIVCCAGPALIAAGVLGAVGRFLGNPIVVAASVALAVVAVTAVVRRRGRDECCTPAQVDTESDRVRDREVR